MTTRFLILRPIALMLALSAALLAACGARSVSRRT
jgi:hypothetical protein